MCDMPHFLDALLIPDFLHELEKLIELGREREQAIFKCSALISSDALLLIFFNSLTFEKSMACKF